MKNFLISLVFFSWCSLLFAAPLERNFDAFRQALKANGAVRIDEVDLPAAPYLPGAKRFRAFHADGKLLLQIDGVKDEFDEWHYTNLRTQLPAAATHFVVDFLMTTKAEGPISEIHIPLFKSLLETAFRQGTVTCLPPSNTSDKAGVGFTAIPGKLAMDGELVDPEMLPYVAMQLTESWQQFEKAKPFPKISDRFPLFNFMLDAQGLIVSNFLDEIWLKKLENRYFTREAGLADGKRSFSVQVDAHGLPIALEALAWSPAQEDIDREFEYLWSKASPFIPFLVATQPAMQQLQMRALPGKPDRYFYREFGTAVTEPVLLPTQLDSFPIEIGQKRLCSQAFSAFQQTSAQLYRHRKQ